MKNLIKRKAAKPEQAEKTENAPAKKVAQCCAKTSKIVAGCHD
jgi:hypothetical protein